MSDDYRQGLEQRVSTLEQRLERLASREKVATVVPWNPVSGGVVYVDPSGTGALTTEAAFIYDDVNNELVVGRARLTEQATPSTPPNPYAILFANASGVMSSVDDAGVVREMVRRSEGNWTPTIAGSATAGTFTYDTTNTKIQYERVGNRVYYNGRIIVTATSVAPAGNMSITGLPFTSGANSNNGNILGGGVIAQSGIDMPAGYTQVTGVVVGASTTIFLYRSGDNVTRSIIQGSEMLSSFDLFIVGSYKVD